MYCIAVTSRNNLSESVSASISMGKLEIVTLQNKWHCLHGLSRLALRRYCIITGLRWLDCLWRDQIRQLAVFFNEKLDLYACYGELRTKGTVSFFRKWVILLLCMKKKRWSWSLRAVILIPLYYPLSCSSTSPHCAFCLVFFPPTGPFSWPFSPENSSVFFVKRQAFWYDCCLPTRRL